MTSLIKLFFRLATGLESNGYRFATILPGGGSKLLIEWPGKPLPDVGEAGANDRERYVAHLAWPIAPEQGKLVFLLMSDGQLRSKPFDGKEPDPASIIQRDADGGNWRSDWPVYTR